MVFFRSEGGGGGPSPPVGAPLRDIDLRSNLRYPFEGKKSPAPKRLTYNFISGRKGQTPTLMNPAPAVERKIGHCAGQSDRRPEGRDLTRAPLGYFYNAPHWGGGGGLFRVPPLISETTGPILKIQAAFESPGKTVEWKQIALISGSRVTSQVRSKSKCSTFRAWWHRRAKLRC